MLKEGDRVEVGANPTIKIGDSFMFLKPHAAVRRTLSDDIKGDLDDLAKEVRVQLSRALRVEVDFVNTVYAALGDEPDLEKLVALCEKELGDGEKHFSFEVVGSEGEDQGQTEPVGEFGPKSEEDAQGTGGKKKPKVKIGKPIKIVGPKKLAKSKGKFTKPHA
jgi:hypothetical protein